MQPKNMIVRICLLSLLLTAPAQGKSPSSKFFLAIGGIDGQAADGHKLEGQFGTIYRSADGENWKQVFKGGPVTDGFSHANNNLLRCLTYGNGKFVVTGNAKAVFVSSDATDWQTIETPSGAMSVEYGNGMFLAPTASHFMTSTDAIDWKNDKQPGDFKVWGPDGAGHIRKTVFGNGVFVCIGENRLGVTKDGKTWRHHQIFGPKQKPGRQLLLFGNRRFLWLTENAGPKTSSDGIDWQPVVSFRFLPDGAKFGNCGVFDGQRFIVSPGGGAIYHSTDGVTFSKKFSDARMTTFCAAGNGLLLQNNGWSKSFVVSADGGLTAKQVKANIPSRKAYFFDGKRIIGQSGG